MSLCLRLFTPRIGLIGTGLFLTYFVVIILIIIACWEGVFLSGKVTSPFLDRPAIIVIAFTLASPALILLIKIRVAIEKLFDKTDAWIALCLDWEDWWSKKINLVISMCCYVLVTSGMLYHQFKNWNSLDHTHWQFLGGRLPFPSICNIWFLGWCWLFDVSVLFTAVQIVFLGIVIRRGLKKQRFNKNSTLVVLDPDNCGGFSRFGDVSIYIGGLLLLFGVMSYCAAFASYLEGVSEGITDTRILCGLVIYLLAVPVVTLSVIMGIPPYIAQLKVKMIEPLLTEYNELLKEYYLTSNKVEKGMLMSQMSNLKELILSINRIFLIPISKRNRAFAIVLYSTAFAPLLILLLSEYIKKFAR